MSGIYVGKTEEDQETLLMFSLSKSGIVIFLVFWVFSWSWRKGTAA